MSGSIDLLTALDLLGKAEEARDDFQRRCVRLHEALRNESLRTESAFQQRDVAEARVAEAEEILRRAGVAGSDELIGMVEILIAAWEETRRESERAETRVAELEAALEKIAENAEAWHGPPPDDSGHVRSLAVIATSARAVLAAVRQEKL